MGKGANTSGMEFEEGLPKLPTSEKISLVLLSGVQSTDTKYKVYAQSASGWDRQSAPPQPYLVCEKLANALAGNAVKGLCLVKLASPLLRIVT